MKGSFDPFPPRNEKHCDRRKKKKHKRLTTAMESQGINNLRLAKLKEAKHEHKTLPSAPLK